MVAAADVTARPDDEPVVRFAAEVLGFRLKPRQGDLLNELYRDGIRTGVLRLGRRSGKGRMAAVVAAFESTVNADKHLAAVPAGEQVAVVVVATSKAQARVTHRMVAGFLRTPALAPLVVRETEDELELSNGMVILTMPCSARSVRGWAICTLVMDEAAWFLTIDNSPMDAGELWNALVPSTAQFPAGKVLVLSTPRWATGWFPDLVRQANDPAHPDMRAWHASTAEMRPDLSAAFLAAEQEKDPIAFKREYLAEFTDALSSAFDEESVRAAVAEWTVRAPEQGHRYAMSVDAAYVGDAFAVGVAHLAGDRLIVDRIDAWRGSKAQPLSHREVLGRVADVNRAYGQGPVYLDQYAAEPVRQGLAELGVMAIPMPWTSEVKTTAVTALRQLFFQNRIELPDDKAMTAELLAYEQTVLPSGRPRYGAAPGSHDDRVSVLLALAQQLAAVKSRSRSYSGIPRPSAGPVTRRGDLTLVGAAYVDQKPHVEPHR